MTRRRQAVPIAEYRERRLAQWKRLELLEDVVLGLAVCAFFVIVAIVAVAT